MGGSGVGVHFAAHVTGVAGGGGSLWRRLAHDAGLRGTGRAGLRRAGAGWQPTCALLWAGAVQALLCDWQFDKALAVLNYRGKTFESIDVRPATQGDGSFVLACFKIGERTRWVPVRTIWWKICRLARPWTGEDTDQPTLYRSFKAAWKHLATQGR